jgi:hypothetical protein
MTKLEVLRLTAEMDTLLRIAKDLESGSVRDALLARAAALKILLQDEKTQ